MTQSLPSVNWCNDAKDYPRNSDRTLNAYALDGIRHQLDMQASRLFTEEGKAALDFLDLGDSAQGKLNIILSRRDGGSLRLPARFLAKSYRKR